MYQNGHPPLNPPSSNRPICQQCGCPRPTPQMTANSEKQPRNGGELLDQLVYLLEETKQKLFLIFNIYFKMLKNFSIF
jgi:hypothetical protein